MHALQLVPSVLSVMLMANVIAKKVIQVQNVIVAKTAIMVSPSVKVRHICSQTYSYNIPWHNDTGIH